MTNEQIKTIDSFTAKDALELAVNAEDTEKVINKSAEYTRSIIIYIQEHAKLGDLMAIFSFGDYYLPPLEVENGYLIYNILLRLKAKDFRFWVDASSKKLYVFWDTGVAKVFLNKMLNNF